MSDIKNRTKCCNPLTKTHCTSNLENVTESLVEKLISKGGCSNINTSMLICTSCKRDIYRNFSKSTKTIEQTDNKIVENEAQQPSTSAIIVETSDESDQCKSSPATPKNIYETRSNVVKEVNRFVPVIGVSPIVPNKLSQVKYPVQKLNEIHRGLKRHCFDIEDSNLPERSQKEKDYDEMIVQLKDKFPDSSRAEKLRILTVLPKSWSVSRIMSEFNISQYIASQAKKLVNEKGILSTPGSRTGRGLSEEIKTSVILFYESDDVSRVMPGMNDYVSIHIEGVRQRIQKRLMMMSLKEAYRMFLEEIQEIKISFSKFVALRPKYCQLLNASGSHNVCVCTIHENVNLMLYGAKIAAVSDGQLKDFKDCINGLVCQQPNYSCYLRKCKSCPTLISAQETLSQMFFDKDVNEVVFDQWITIDRCDLATVIKTVDEFIPYFYEKIEKLITHDFMKNEQSKFLKERKQSLKEGELIVICDFAENYSFVVQNAVQGYHWNNKQATIHPFVVYYKHEGDVKHISFIVISEVLKHENTTVHLFISKLMEFF